MEILWTGKYIKENFPIHEFQLFDLLRAGVRAFTYDGLKVVDRDPLLRKEYTLESLEEYEWNLENLRQGTEETGTVIVRGGSCGGYREARKQLSRIETNMIALRKEEKLPKIFWDDPECCESISFSLNDKIEPRRLAIERAVTFRYAAADVDKYFDNKDKQSHPLAVKINQVLSVPDYIKQRKTEGAKKEMIAAELYDKKGNFKLTYIKIARELGLDKDIQPNQYDALKHRGKRACDKGKTMLSPRKKSKKP